MSTSYLEKLNSDFSADKDEEVMESIFTQYERVVVESIVTSFGLDFLINDKHGGDVDTIHNVRQIGVDDSMTYKNTKNEEAYNTRGSYNEKTQEYHTHNTFTSKKHNARQEFNEQGKTVQDAYTGKDLKFTTANTVPDDEKAELDHIVECQHIHNDRGRVLSGLSGVDLANSEENFAWTNRSLNASMGGWAMQKNEKWKKEHGCDAPLSELDMRAYLKEHPKIPPEDQKRMLKEYDKARKAYEHKLFVAYYTSPAFARDTAVAMGNVGVRMGLRQVAGFVFTEIWFSVKEEFQKLDNNFDVGDLFVSIGEGINRGFANAKSKYDVLMRKFWDGAVAGAISSLTTTLTNIFVTTAKNTVRIIRQTWASLVEAVKILLFNPDRLLWGDRIKAAVKVLAMGASVVAGVMVSELIEKTGVGTVPVIGDVIQSFCGTFVTGILSCTLLYVMDRSKIVQSVVDWLNSIATMDTIIDQYKEIADRFEEYCAKLQEINIEDFKKETAIFGQIASRLEYAGQTDESLCSYLHDAYKMNNISLPWQGDFKTFMGNKNNRLVFQ